MGPYGIHIVNILIKRYPLVMSNIAIEHDPFIVDLPIQDGDFP